jgi:hypothetical protein
VPAIGSDEMQGQTRNIGYLLSKVEFSTIISTLLIDDVIDISAFGSDEIQGQTGNTGYLLNGTGFSAIINAPLIEDVIQIIIAHIDEYDIVRQKA